MSTSEQISLLGVLTLVYQVVVFDFLAGKVTSCIVLFISFTLSESITQPESPPCQRESQGEHTE